MSFISGRKLRYSCRRMIILGNIITILSWWILWIPYIIAWVVGRILRGVVIGMMSVVVPYFINEVASKSMKLQWLGLIQQGIVMGSFFAYWMRLLIPVIIIPEDGDDRDYWHSIKGKELNWQYLFLFPIFPSIIQLFFICFVFKYDVRLHK